MFLELCKRFGLLELRQGPEGASHVVPESESFLVVRVYQDSLELVPGSRPSSLS